MEPAKAGMYVVRRALKFLHLLGAAGFMGGLVTQAALVALTWGWVRTPGYAPMTVALARVATWIVIPSMVLVVASGLLSMAVVSGFHGALWAWAKAATGVFILETGLQVLGPFQDEAAQAAAAAAASGAPDPAAAAHLLIAEATTLGLLLAVSIADVALGVWRPHLRQRRTQAGRRLRA